MCSIPFPGLTKENIDAPWYLMCPHEIQSVKGYALEDYYGEEWERRYQSCVEDPRIQKRVVSVKDLVRLVLKSAVETGTPFTFNRATKASFTARTCVPRSPRTWRRFPL